MHNFLLEVKEEFTTYGQCQMYCCLGDAMSQGISTHGCDLICTWTFCSQLPAKWLKWIDASAFDLQLSIVRQLFCQYNNSAQRGQKDVAVIKGK